MRTVRLLAMLLACTVSISGDSSIGLTARDDGFATDPVAFGPASGLQAFSDIDAADGLTWVAWYDHDRVQPRGMLSRVDSEGRLLDPIGRPAGGYATRLVPDIGGVRLFWSEIEDSALVLRSTRASSDGSVGGGEVVVRLPVGPGIGGFDVAQNASGRNLVVIGPHLVLLDGTRVVRQATLGGWGSPSRVVALEDGWGVAWVASGGFAMWAAFDSDLEAIGPAGGTAVADGVSLIDLSSEGNTFLYAVSGVIGLDVWKIIPQSGDMTRVVELDIAFTNPVLTKLGTERHLLSWTGSNGIEGAEISNGVIGEARVLVSGGGFGFGVIARDGGLTVADSRGGCFRTICEGDTFVTSLSAEGSASVLLSAAAARQTRPRLSREGDSTFAAWMQFGAQPVLAWGRVRDDGRVDVREHAPGKSVSAPSIAVWQGRAIVLWSSISLETFEPVVEGFVLDGDGVPLSTLEIPTTGEAQTLGVAGGPDGWLVAWFEWVAGEGRLAVRRIGFEGTPAGPPIVVGPGETFQLGLGLARSDREFVLAWVARDGEGPFRLRSARVTSTDQIVHGNDLAVSDGFVLHPSVSCRHRDCLAVWSDDVDGNGDYDVAGRFFDSSGLTAMSPVFRIADSQLVEASPLAASIDEAWVVTWTERDASSAASNLRAARVGAALPFPHPSVFAGPVSFVDSENHALACGDSDCLSLRVLTVDDPVRGRTHQLMRTSIHESSRHRGVRRDE